MHSRTECLFAAVQSLSSVHRIPYQRQRPANKEGNDTQGITFEKVRRVKNRSPKIMISAKREICGIEEKTSARGATITQFARGRHFNTNTRWTRNVAYSFILTRSITNFKAWKRFHIPQLCYTEYVCFKTLWRSVNTFSGIPAGCIDCAISSDRPEAEVRQNFAFSISRFADLLVNWLLRDWHEVFATKSMG